MTSHNLRDENGLGDTRLALATCVITGIILTVLRATEAALDREALLLSLVLFPPALYVTVKGIGIAIATCLGGRERRRVGTEELCQSVDVRRVTGRSTGLVCACVGLLAVLADALNEREVLITFGSALLGGLIALSSRRQAPVADGGAVRHETAVPMQLAGEHVVPAVSTLAVTDQPVVTPARRSVLETIGPNVIRFQPRPAYRVWGQDSRHRAYLRSKGLWGQVVRFGPYWATYQAWKDGKRRYEQEQAWKASATPGDDACARGSSGEVSGPKGGAPCSGTDRAPA